MRRFERESQKLREISQTHRGVIRCFESGKQAIRNRVYAWYAMEFAPGGSLADRLQQRITKECELPWANPATRERLIREFAAILSAVAHLHSHGLVHRDIKPGNVLVMDNAELRLADFGIVKSVRPTRDSQSDSMNAKGTRLYIAPEQELTSDVGTTADVYSLGIVLRELACGVLPDRTGDVQEGSTLQSFKPLQQLPPQIAKLIRRCTDIDPSCRPSDATGLQSEFARVVSEDIVTIPAASN